MRETEELVMNRLLRSGWCVERCIGFKDGGDTGVGCRVFSASILDNSALSFLISASFLLNSGPQI